MRVFLGYFLVFLRVFFRVFGKYFFGFSVSGKVFFWVVQKYPTPLIPACRFVKSTPDINDVWSGCDEFSREPYRLDISLL